MNINGVDLTGMGVRILVDEEKFDFSVSEKTQSKSSESLQAVVSSRSKKPISSGLYFRVVPGGDEYIVIAEREPDWAKFDSETGRGKN